MHSKVILPVLLGILIIGITQFAFAGELEKTTFIEVDEEEFAQPQSKYKYQEITIIGHIEDYHRGDMVTITIIYPDETELDFNTFASKRGDIYTLLHFTHESQIGTHMVFLEYGGEIAFTMFEILENKEIIKEG